MRKRTLLLVAAVASLTACGGGANTAAPHKAATAEVAYAGSLQKVNEQVVGPAFAKTTGLVYSGQGGGSLAVAREIQGGVLRPNVFMSLGAAPWQLLGKQSPYAIAFLSSPLCIAYSPQSPFAPQLRAIALGHQPLSRLFSLLAQPTFHLGRTNPETDPQGQAFVLAVQAGVRAAGLSPSLATRILGPLASGPEVFAEEAILSRLQSGQLDASSAFVPEAVQRHLPYIALPPAENFGDPALAQEYAHLSFVLADGKRVTGQPMLVLIAPVRGTKDQSAGERFIAFALSKRGLELYRKQGFTPVAPQILGSKAAVPTEVRRAAAA